MLFRVKHTSNGRVYTVYSVKQASRAHDCQFLVYDSLEFGWIWIKADQFIPAEE